MRIFRHQEYGFTLMKHLNSICAECSVSVSKSPHYTDDDASCCCILLFATSEVPSQHVGCFLEINCGNRTSVNPQSLDSVNLTAAPQQQMGWRRRPRHPPPSPEPLSSCLPISPFHLGVIHPVFLRLSLLSLPSSFTSRVHEAIFGPCYLSSVSDHKP